CSSGLSEVGSFRSDALHGRSNPERHRVNETERTGAGDDERRSNLSDDLSASIYDDDILDLESLAAEQELTAALPELPDEAIVEEGEIALTEVDESLVASALEQDGFRRAAAKARQFPQEPGCYLMKDNRSVVIYVGKAKNLRSRASTYFQARAVAEYRM